jgi:hypothetical protein
MCQQTGVLRYDILYKEETQTERKPKMANPNPVIRNEAQELQRQISFARTLRERVYRKADEKATQYDEKIADLEAKLETLN